MDEFLEHILVAILVMAIFTVFIIIDKVRANKERKRFDDYIKKLHDERDRDYLNNAS